MTRGILARGVLVLVVIWGLVFGVTAWSARKKATPEKVAETLDLGSFSDWSLRDASTMSEGERSQRREVLDDLANMIQALDLRERSEVFANPDYWIIGSRLSTDEGQYLVDRIMGESGKRMLEMFDQLDPKSREEMIERAVRKLESGEGAGQLARLEEENPALVKAFARAGGKLFFKEASVKTKFALLPFLDRIRESLQGFGKPDLGEL
jgi:hypothetical protein